MVGEGPTYGINRSFGPPEKKFSINFSKAKTKCSWVCITVVIKEIYMFKDDNKNVNFLTQLCLESISDKIAGVDNYQCYW